MMADISPSTSTDGDTDDKNMRVISTTLFFRYFILRSLNEQFLIPNFSLVSSSYFSTGDVIHFPLFCDLMGMPMLRLMFDILEIMYAVSK